MNGVEAPNRVETLGGKCISWDALSMRVKPDQAWSKPER